MEKVVRFVIELQNFLYADRLALPRWRLLAGGLEPERISLVRAEQLPEVELPAPWGGYDQTAWFFAQVEIPEAWQGDAVQLVFDVGESLLFVNGKPAQGIDANHREYLLTPRARGGERYSLALEAYAGLVADKRIFARAELRRVRREPWQLYFDLRVALDVLAGLQRGSRDHRRVTALLQETLELLDPREPGSRDYFAAVARAGRHFRRQWMEMLSEEPGRVWVVGHSHIDLAWLWRMQEVKRKAARTFATALALMDEYPWYHFVQSQPQLYAFVKSCYPELYQRIRSKIQAGQWEPTGGMWVEADCNLSSGESLVRQLLYGQTFFEREFGVPSKVLWQPDVFGYSWVLPQLLKKAGIEYFFTAKMGWLYTNPFPHSTFWWQGVDGSRVLAHLCFHKQAYSAGLDAAGVRHAWETFRQKEECDDVMLSFGHGDGGGGPTREQLEHQRRLAHAPGHPQVRQGRLEEFFAAAHKSGDALHVWADELYLEGHRGTYTTRGAVKRANRKCELLLRDAELLSAIAWRLGESYPAQIFRECWEKVLRNQFHDILAGSCIPEVYEDAMADYAAVQEGAGRERDRALRAICQGIDTSGSAENLVVFNTLGWERTDLVAVPADQLPPAFRLEDLEGRPVPYQKVRRVDGSTEVLFVAREVPACGYTTFRVLPGPQRREELHCQVEGALVRTPHFEVQLNARGELSRLIDNALGGEVLAEGSLGNVLQCFLDYPSFWESWEIDEDYETRPLNLLRAAAGPRVKAGPVCAVARVRMSGGRSWWLQDIYLYRDLRRIDFDTLLNWHEPRTLLKVAFPVAVTADRATYEIQFAAITRSTRRNTSWDGARFEVPAQRWADLSDGGRGVSLLNDCKYGHDVHENVLRLTLLRNCYAPDPVECQYGVQYGGQTDSGLHRVVYSLWPHQGDWRSGRTVQAAYELNAPLLAVREKGHSGSLPPRQSFVALRGCPSVVVDTLKQSEDGKGLVLRLYEFCGQQAKAKLSTDLATGCRIVNLLERECGPAPVRKGEAVVELSPFEVLSLKLV